MKRKLTGLDVRGTYTALITPFNEDLSIDWKTYEKLVQRQAEAGNHLVPVGTTGESPTLNNKEHRDVFEITIDIAKDYPGIQVVAGIGSNNTIEAVDLTEFALKCGADAGLSVTPYYNKPQQKGHYLHQIAIANVGLPIILYNIPGRSASGMTSDTILKLAEHDNIIGLKAADGLEGVLSPVLEGRPDGFSVLSGDDPLTHEMIRLGAEGVVSVASNLFPEKINRYVDLMLTQGSDSASDLTAEYLPILAAIMSSGTNPEGIKESMYIAREAIGVPDYQPGLRLPMVRIGEQERNELREVINMYID